MSKVAVLGGLSRSAHKQVLIMPLPRVPYVPHRDHFLSSELAVSLPWSSFSRSPKPGDHLGCLLCKETSSKLDRSPSCAHHLRSEVAVSLAGFSPPASRLSAGDHRGDRDPESLAPAPCYGTVIKAPLAEDEHQIQLPRVSAQHTPQSKAWSWRSRASSSKLTQLGAARRVHFLETRPRDARNHLRAVS